MTFSTVGMRILILAAYLLAATLPLLAAGEGRRLSDVEHASLMAASGQIMPMASTGSADNTTALMLCQQHCLFDAAALPAPNPAARAVARARGVKVGIVRLALSLAIPPPGPPPKVALI